MVRSLVLAALLALPGGAAADDAAEAVRLGCGYVLRNGAPEAVAGGEGE